MPDYRLIPLAQLIEPVMPVRFAMDDDKMASLVESVRANGILQNLIVVLSDEQSGGIPPMPIESGAAPPEPKPPLYEIVAGHRRYKAACICKLAEVPCLIFAAKDIAIHAARLAENAEREDCTPAEEAVYYRELIEKYDLTEEQLLATVRQKGEYVYRRLQLLRGHKFIFEAVAARQISHNMALKLNQVDDEAHAKYLLALVIEGGATVRTADKWVQEYKANGPGPVVDHAAMVEQGKAASALPVAPVCFICRSSAYPANIVWVPIHDFERDQIIARVDAAAQFPEEAAASPADAAAKGA
jgi:ParB family chromosome partitioning protein